MYGVDMYYSIKTLIKQGKNNKEISKILKVHRNTVTNIRKKLEKGEAFPVKNNRKSECEKYHEEIIEYLGEGKSAVLIHRELKESRQTELSYGAIRNYVKKIRGSECYIPLITPAGYEAQIDFGYGGLMKLGNKKVKVWIFCMTLSSSRQAYYELVTDQKTRTFINCHIRGFEYFGGVPETVKIDNLKSAVLEASFYEPLFQVEYARFLEHYNTNGITCRVRRGQDKGKVESGVKYVKNNFIKGLKSPEYYSAQKELRSWLNNICNKRIHGTTRKVPEEEFYTKEKPKLKKLPENRYEFFDVEKRKVNNYGHIYYKNNYYSVPYKYQGKEVTVKTNGKIIKVYDYCDEIAIHTVCFESGEFITQEAHKPPYKQKRSSDYYFEKAKSAGTDIYNFAKKAQEKKMGNWHRILMGVLNLLKYYSNEDVNLACRRALQVEAISSRLVKEILNKDLQKIELETEANLCVNGFNTDLSVYDKIKLMRDFK